MTLFTLLSRNLDKEAATSVLRYGAAAIACMVFSVVYESFSHGVYSPWMMGLFMVPLLLGCVPAAITGWLGIRISWLRRQLWACAVLTLTLGCCFAGVMEIYGSPSPWTPVFAVLGGLLMLASAFAQATPQR